MTWWSKAAIFVSFLLVVAASGILTGWRGKRGPDE
jgi:hypothetical protein